MLPLEPLGRLQARLAPDSALIEALSALREVLPIGQGESVRAAIGEPLPDGRQQLQVGDRTFVLRLPPNVRQGDTIELTPTRNGLEARIVMPQSPPEAESSQSQLSAAGRLVAELASSTSDAAKPALIAGGAMPLMDGDSSTEPARIVQALREAIATSGLFYESHLVEWVAGERALPTVQLEPQAQLITAAPAVKPDGVDAATAGVGSLSTAGIENDSAQQPSATAHEVLHQEDSAVLPPAARELVREQLSLLESQQLIWSGPVWPGQMMEWEIGGEPAHEADADAHYAWHTKLYLELPHLGVIEARLAWGRHRLDLHLAADAAQQQTLTQALPALQAALQNAGIPASTLKVQDHDVQ